MQTPAKIVFSVVLACLLLASAGGRRHRGCERDNHVGRDRQRVAMRLRRLRTDHPTHHPSRPAPAAVIPPDDDDDDENRLRLAWGDTREFVHAHHEELLVVHPQFPPTAPPLAAGQPLYRTLHILLI